MIFCSHDLGFIGKQFGARIPLSIDQVIRSKTGAIAIGLKEKRRIVICHSSVAECSCAALESRFRGNNSALGSAELRQTVWTQTEERGLDVFGFGDAGQVWGDNRSQTDAAILENQDFDSSNWRASVGGGFQYRYSRRLALRIEMGHSNERNLIYVSLSRGF